MSRALARDERIPLDAYYTPDDVAQKCVAAIEMGEPPTCIIEPSVGGGAFVRAVHARWPLARVRGCDVNPFADFKGCQDYAVGDWVEWSPATESRPSLIVGNPPYGQAEEHLRHAFRWQPRCVAFLLRLNFLEGQKRRAFWDLHPPAHVHVLSKRPSFTDGGSDATAYGFFVWRTDWADEPTLGWL